MGRGAKREGKEIEKGGLMQRDTNGKVEFIRLTTTNSKDGGVDYIKIVKGDFNYKKYNNKLKRRKNADEKKK